MIKVSKESSKHIKLQTTLIAEQAHIKKDNGLFKCIQNFLAQ